MHFCENRCLILGMRFSIQQMFIVGLMFLPRAVLAITNTGGQQGGGGGSGLAIVSDSLSTGAVCLVMLVVMGYAVFCLAQKRHHKPRNSIGLRHD